MLLTVAAVFARQDMVKMMGQGNIILMQQAVLTLLLRPLSDATFQLAGCIWKACRATATTRWQGEHALRSRRGG